MSPIITQESDAPLSQVQETSIRKNTEADSLPAGVESRVEFLLRPVKRAAQAAVLAVGFFGTGNDTSSADPNIPREDPISFKKEFDLAQEIPGRPRLSTDKSDELLYHADLAKYGIDMGKNKSKNPEYRLIVLELMRNPSIVTQRYAAWWAGVYRISEATASAIRRTGAEGGRIVAIGTTVVRALEHAVMRSAVIRGGEGIADQRVGPTSPLRIVDVIVSGTHEPESSHYQLLRAFADDDTLTEANAALEARGYRTHEFGDSVLIERKNRAAGAGEVGDVGQKLVAAAA